MSKDNTALTKCYFCGGDNIIILATRYNNKGEPLEDLKPYHGKVIDTTPCTDCEEYMKQCIILISVRNEDHNNKNPYRTGGFVVIEEEVMRQIAPDADLSKRCLFVSDEIWDALGLPRIKPQVNVVK